MQQKATINSTAPCTSITWLERVPHLHQGDSPLDLLPFTTLVIVLIIFVFLGFPVLLFLCLLFPFLLQNSFVFFSASPGFGVELKSLI